jgi:hypothetical protein
LPALTQELALAMGYKKQSALQTPLTAAAIWALSQTNRTIGQPNIVNEVNAADIGKSHEWSTQLFPSHIEVVQPWDARLSSQNAAVLGAYGLGKRTSKGAAGTGFVYVFDPLVNITDGIEMPSTTFVSSVRQGGSALFDLALVGMICNEFHIMLRSGPGRDNATMTSSWMGCGKYVSPSTITIPALSTENLLNAGGTVTLTIGATNYITAKTFISMDLGWMNNVTQGFYPGSGSQSGANIAGRMRHGARSLSFKVIAEMEASSAELAAYLAQTEVAISVKVEGAVIGAGPDKHTLQIDIPRAVVKAAPLTDQSNIIAIEPDFEMLLDPTYGILTMTVITDQDDIGTAVA